MLATNNEFKLLLFETEPLEMEFHLMSCMLLQLQL